MGVMCGCILCLIGTIESDRYRSSFTVSGEQCFVFNHRPFAPLTVNGVSKGYNNLYFVSSEIHRVAESNSPFEDCDHLVTTGLPAAPHAALLSGSLPGVGSTV
jgi:hypothetical protein